VSTPRPLVGNGAQFWLNLQSAYDVRLAKKKVGREIAKLPPNVPGFCEYQDVSA